MGQQHRKHGKRAPCGNPPGLHSLKKRYPPPEFTQTLTRPDGLGTLKTRWAVWKLIEYGEEDSWRYAERKAGWVYHSCLNEVKHEAT